MKILAISGSPRGISSVNGRGERFIEIPRPGGVVEPVAVDSACMRLAGAFVEGASEAGHACTLVSLHELDDIKPCRACYGCLKTGKCVVRDDMQTLYRAFDATEAVVFVSPIYYAMVPAQLLAVINRLYPYWIDGIRYPKLPGGAAVIGTCADLGQSWELFDGFWHSVFNEVGWAERGIVHAPRFKDRAEEYLETVRAFGRGF